MTNWIICALIVSLCISLAVNYVRGQMIKKINNDLADANGWIDPICIPSWREQKNRQMVAPQAVTAGKQRKGQAG